MDKYKDYFGVYCGRFNPLHLGHEKVISEMLNMFGPDRSRLIIGSANTAQSMKHFFSYNERKEFIKTVFPDLNVVPLGDFSTGNIASDDSVWIGALDDILVSSGFDPRKTMFFGGCEEDISFFIKFDREYHILNRFDGTTPKVSATEVRDALIHERSLENFLNPLIRSGVKSLFDKKWHEFQSK